MVWLSRFIAAILVSIITIALLTQIFNSTLLNSSFIDKVAVNDNLYSKLSTELSNQIISKANNNSNQQMTQAQLESAVNSVITPALIHQKVKTTLSGIQAYYKGNGPVPTLSLSDVITKLQAEGIPINNGNSPISQTINLPINTKVRDQVQNFEKLRLYSAIVAILLFGLLVFLSWEEHRWKILPDLGIIIGTLLGIYGLMFIFGVSLVEKFTKANVNANKLTTIISGFAKDLTHQVGYIIAIIAVIVLAISITSRVLLKVRAKPAIKKPLPKTKKVIV